MKKYNLSNIMKRAWEIVKQAAETMSEALKQAWKEAKDMMEKIKFEGRARIAKIYNGEISQTVGTDNESESDFYTFNLWEHGAMKRIYINDYKRRGMGYIDVTTGQIVADSRYAIETAKYFMEAYEL